METCMLLCFHVHIAWKHACFSVNVYMKAHYHACSHVLLQLVLPFDPHWKRVHSTSFCVFAERLGTRLGHAFTAVI